ncbi:MAG: hypothetical protein PHI66_01800 [Candidatus Pacebacteria bacterium]|nr:hypothetical protein [Candidatus Paceibacterota bacterium]
MKKYPVLSDTLVLIVELIFIVGIGTVLGINLFAVKNSEVDTADIASEELMSSLPEVEKASDEKSIVNTKTKEVILTIDEVQAYLEQSGLAYDSETFMTTDAKYVGNSFNQIAVSNDRQKMVFSTYGLAGDIPQPWIGIYELVITDSFCASEDRAGIIPSASACIGEEPEWQVRFLTGGGGMNFVWSQDDKTISYEADFRAESGLDKTINISTGEVTITENCEEYNEKFFTSKDDCYEWIARANEDGSSYNDLTDKTLQLADWRTYQDKEYGFEFKYPEEWEATSNVFTPAISGGDNFYVGAEIIQEVLLFKTDVQGAVFVLQISNKQIDDLIDFDKSSFGLRTGEVVEIAGMKGERLDGAFYGMQYFYKDGKTYIFHQVNSVSEDDQKDYDSVINSFDFPDQMIEIIFPNGKQKLFVCGRNYQITWTPINSENLVDIKIYNNCKSCTSRGIVWQKLGVENSGSYDFYVPFSVSTGGSHQIEITESSDDGVYTGQSVEFVIAD